jgi:transcriptional regulator with XRE-family HTH domain
MLSSGVMPSRSVSVPGVGLGERIRTLRRKSGLTQEDVSRSTGLSVRQLSKLESGSAVDCRLSTKQRIAAALGVTLHDIDPQAKIPLANSLTPEQREFIEGYLSLSPDDAKVLREVYDELRARKARGTKRGSHS